MSILIKGMEMPPCCADCWAVDDYGDYTRCRITGEQRGYRFPYAEQIMDNCPLSPAPERERWIPVTERLPEDGSEYLCRTESGCHHVLMCADGKFNAFRLSNGKLYDKNEIKDIAYWMPIPEPPEEEKA